MAETDKSTPVTNKWSDELQKITLQNALARKLLLEFDDGTEPVLFANVTALLQAGWVIIPVENCHSFRS